MEVTSISLQLIECNIDDLNPELFPYVLDRLFAAGARDAWITPIVMKKGRPAQCLSVLCEKQLHSAIAEVLFVETTTLGLRTSEVQREELSRENRTVETEFGTIRIKVGFASAGVVANAAPEYEDCRQVAEKQGVALKVVYQAAMKAFEA